MAEQVTGSKLKWLWLAVLVIVLDLGTKAMATAMLTYGDPVPVIPMFNLTLLHNTGAAFSFLAEAGRLAALVLRNPGPCGQRGTDLLAEKPSAP